MHHDMSLLQPVDLDGLVQLHPPEPLSVALHVLAVDLSAVGQPHVVQGVEAEQDRAQGVHGQVVAAVQLQGPEGFNDSSTVP